MTLWHARWVVVALAAVVVASAAAPTFVRAQQPESAAPPNPPASEGGAAKDADDAAPQDAPSEPAPAPPAKPKNAVGSSGPPPPLRPKPRNWDYNPATVPPALATPRFDPSPKPPLGYRNRYPGPVGGSATFPPLTRRGNPGGAPYNPAGPR